MRSVRGQDLHYFRMPLSKGDSMTDDVEIQWEVQFIWSMPGKQTPYVKTLCISPSELNARTLAHQARAF